MKRDSIQGQSNKRLDWTCQERASLISNLAEPSALGASSEYERV